MQFWQKISERWLKIGWYIPQLVLFLSPQCSMCTYWPLMADSTLSNSRNILTASSSGTSAIWGDRCVWFNPCDHTFTSRHDLRLSPQKWHISPLCHISRTLLSSLPPGLRPPLLGPPCSARQAQDIRPVCLILTQTWYGDGLQLINKLTTQTRTYPQQDHFGRVFEDLSERIGFRLLGSIGWLDGNRNKSQRTTMCNSKRYHFVFELRSMWMISVTVQSMFCWRAIGKDVIFTSAKSAVFATFEQLVYCVSHAAEETLKGSLMCKNTSCS